MLDYIKTDLQPKYKVGLLSNIEAGGLGKYFNNVDPESILDAVVLSGDIGFSKPHSEAYQNVCKKLGVDAEDAVMIDDSLVNVNGAQAVGMHGLLFFNLAQAKQELETLLADTNN